MAIEYVSAPPEFKKVLEDIFTDEFMQAHSRFQTFAGFQYSSAVFVNWKADTLIYNAEVFDNFVNESTQFTSWDEMVQTAVEEARARKTKEQ